MVKHINFPPKAAHKGGVAKLKPHATASCGHHTCTCLLQRGAARGVGVFLYAHTTFPQYVFVTL
jgi:hypothetical protein